MPVGMPGDAEEGQRGQEVDCPVNAVVVTGAGALQTPRYKSASAYLLLQTADQAG